MANRLSTVAALDFGRADHRLSLEEYGSRPGAQIDLLIDRRDDVINLCEMKYSEGTYLMSEADEDSIRNEMAAFRAETGTRKAVHPMLVTLGVARHNAQYNSVILREVRVADWLGGERLWCAR